MDSFSKIRESSSREEQKRQMINKAIDLLHKFVNKRVDFGDTKEEISRIVSQYYMVDEPDGLDSAAKVHLEVMINQAFDVINGIKDEKLNLYQAIMLINKIMARKEMSESSLKPSEKSENENNIHPIKLPPPFVSKKEKNREESGDVFSIKMKAVIENKKKLLISIKDLNNELKAHGFSLNSLDPR